MIAHRLFSELRRRRVFRVVGLYAVGAWAAIEVSATVFPLLGFAEWTPTFIVVLALTGFPLATALAWFFDITPEGLVRTDAEGGAPAPAGPRSLAGRAAGFFGLGMLVGLVSVAAYFRFGPADSTPFSAEGIASIAVLPFTDLSASGDQQYFADGMSEELLDRLANVEGLRVAARTSSFAFRGRAEQDIRDIGRRLSVESVLEGSLRREGDRLRVTAQLIDARTGYHLWSETFDREVSSVFAIQDEISNAIVDALRKQFAGADAGEVRRPASLRAHDLYLQGLARWHSRSAANVRQAVALFEQALQEDPEYAAAWAGLAQAYAVLPSVGDMPVGEAIGKGTSAAARALSLDARLPEAHAALGQIAQGFEWNFADAERAYRRAIAFNPGYATAHQWYAETLMMLGRLEEAGAEIDRAVQLDPLSPSGPTVKAYLLAVRGDLPGALDLYREVVTLHPDYSLAQLNRLLIALALGRVDEVADAALPATGDAGLAGTIRALGAAVSEPGRIEAGRRAADRLNAAMAPALGALWYAAIGETERSLDRLAASVAERADPNLPFVMLHPLLSGLRRDPRFTRLAEEVGVVLRAG